MDHKSQITRNSSKMVDEETHPSIILRGLLFVITLPLLQHSQPQLTRGRYLLDHAQPQFPSLRLRIVFLRIILRDQSRPPTYSALTDFLSSSNVVISTNRFSSFSCLSWKVEFYLLHSQPTICLNRSKTKQQSHKKFAETAFLLHLA